jgi:D-alanyl-D-alanine carboxypeptidase
MFGVIMAIVKNLLFALLFILFISSCKDEPTKPDENSEKFKTYIQQIDKIADSLTTKRSVKEFPGIDFSYPGIVIGVWSHNIGFSYTVVRGKKDLETGTALQINDLFRIASNTKTFTITVLLQLIDEGKLTLDDKLSSFYPDFPKADTVTIRMLCNMTSGIRQYEENNNFVSALINDYHTNFPPDELINYSKVLPYYFEPGTGFHYANVNTVICGRIIEKLTGNKLEQEIKTRIIDKLGLKNTFFPTNWLFPAGMSYAKGYEFASPTQPKAEVSEKFHPSVNWAAGAMISNFSDLKIWVEALADGKLISANMQNERLQTVYPTWSGVPVLENAKYALGIMNFKNFLGHQGDTSGYHTIILYDPIRKAGVIFLANYDGLPIETAYQVLKVLYPEL